MPPGATRVSALPSAGASTGSGAAGQAASEFSIADAARLEFVEMEDLTPEEAAHHLTHSILTQTYLNYVGANPNALAPDAEFITVDGLKRALTADACTA